MLQEFSGVFHDRSKHVDMSDLACDCVLCFSPIVNHNDKNIVQGRGEFKVYEKILSLQFSDMLVFRIRIKCERNEKGSPQYPDKFTVYLFHTSPLQVLGIPSLNSAFICCCWETILSQCYVVTFYNVQGRRRLFSVTNLFEKHSFRVLLSGFHVLWPQNCVTIPVLRKQNNSILQRMKRNKEFQFS